MSGRRRRRKREGEANRLGKVIETVLTKRAKERGRKCPSSGFDATGRTGDGATAEESFQLTRFTATDCETRYVGNQQH